MTDPTKHMRYVGPLKQLGGTSALVRANDLPDGRFSTVLAQFDEWGARRDGIDLAHGWHEFDASDFETIPDPMDQGDASWCHDPDMGDR